MKEGPKVSPGGQAGSQGNDSLLGSPSLPPLAGKNSLVLLTRDQVTSLLHKGKSPAIVRRVLMNVFHLVEQDKFRASAKRLNQLMGDDNRPLGKWLRLQLLVKVSSGGFKQVARWAIHQDNYLNLWMEMFSAPLTDDDRASMWRQKVMPFMNGQTPIEYATPTEGGRVYHDLQGVPNRLKDRVFKGLKEYDISTAAISIIIQAAHKFDDSYTPTSAIAYVNNKKRMREQLSNYCEVSISNMKKAFTVLGALGEFTASPKNTTFTDIFGSSKAAMRRFLEQSHVIGLKRDMEWAYKVLLKENWVNGDERFRLYEQVENIVMTEASKYCKGKGHNILLQHDGFLLLDEHTSVDCEELQDYVFANTEYRVIFDEDSYGDK